MRNSKHGLKAFVLGIVVVMVAMAFAASAQAQTHVELLSAHAAHSASGGPLNPTPLTNGGTLGTFSVNLAAIGTLKVPLRSTRRHRRSLNCG